MLQCDLELGAMEPSYFVISSQNVAGRSSSAVGNLLVW